jgi:transcriptional regulator with XRE-family HTH domain
MTRSVFSTDYDRFRSLLVSARKERGLTQVELAQRLNRPQSFVSKYERGERRLDLVEFLQVARALNIDAADFVKDLEQGDS